MIVETDFFRNKKPNPQQLLTFGFQPAAKGFIYTQDLLSGKFELRIQITEAGDVQTQLWDQESQEEYGLHRVSGAQGPFVGQVKAAYQQALQTIANQCFTYDVFQSDGAKQLIAYVQDRYQDQLEYLWPKFPRNAVWRRQDNAKWYAALLTVTKEKIGLPGGDTVEIVDLRQPPQELAALIDGKRYFPGYHMNKKHWLTICLDGSVPMAEIYQRLDVSYRLAAKK